MKRVMVGQSAAYGEGSLSKVGRGRKKIGLLGNGKPGRSGKSRVGKDYLIKVLGEMNRGVNQVGGRGGTASVRGDDVFWF